MVNFYEELQVAQTASRSEVKKAYRKLTRTTHPDLGGSAEEFRKVQEAWETLSHNKKREAYDHKLFIGTSPVDLSPPVPSASKSKPTPKFTYGQAPPLYVPPSSYKQPSARTGQRFEEESKKAERARLLAEENSRNQGQDGYSGPRMKNGVVIPDWESLPRIYDRFKFSKADYVQVLGWQRKDRSYWKVSGIVILSLTALIIVPLAIIAGVVTGMTAPDWLDTWLQWVKFSFLYGLAPMLVLCVIVLAVTWAYRFLRYRKYSKINFNFDYRNMDFSEIDLSRIANLLRMIMRL